MSDVVTFLCNDRKEAICPPLTRSINQTTVIRSDAPQEEIERDMICGVMQMNRGTKTIFHSTPINSEERGLQRQRSNKSD